MVDVNQTNLTLRIAVLSDLHFFSSSDRPDKSPSWLQIDGGKLKTTINPWDELTNLIAAEGLTADLLLCPGDLTTASDKMALAFAWEKLDALKGLLNAKILATATGNHDVSSRGVEVGSNAIRDLNQPSDLIGFLKTLSPIYPIVCSSSLFDENEMRKYRTQYFGDDFVRVETDELRLIVLNSCAHHTTQANDFERGYISQSALDELKRQLEANSDRKINVLLCHHHPMQHENHNLGAYDFMFNGQLLTDLLSSHGDWIIFHGHKHHARLAYAPASCNNSAVIFAAASFSAMLRDALSEYSRNQFYLIDVTLDREIGPPMGVVRAWNWHNGCPWTENFDDVAGLPSGCGFGVREHPDLLAKRINEHLGDDAIDWEEIKIDLPWLNNLTPGNLARIENCLERNYRIFLQRDAGIIQLIGRA